MKAIILDASVVLAAVLADEPAHAAARQILAERDSIAFTTLTLPEIAAGLVKAVRHGRLDADAAAEALNLAADLPVTTYDLRPHVAEALARALDEGGHPHDLSQLLAARTAGCLFITADARLARAIQHSELAEQLRLVG